MNGPPEPELSDFLRRFIEEAPRARRPTLAFVQRLAASLSPGACVIDVGAGNAPFRELFRHVSYLTCDWENSLYRPPIPPDIRAPANKLPLEDACIDAILSTDVLEHVADPASVLREFHRVLKPGAPVWLTVPFVWYLHEQPYDYFRYTSHGLRLLLENAGFANIDITPLSDAFSTVAQLTGDLGWMMGRAQDQYDAQREIIARVMKAIAEVISSFSDFDTQWILPVEYSVIAYAQPPQVASQPPEGGETLC